MSGALVFHWPTEKSGLNRDVSTFSKILKIGVSIIVSIPHCPADKVRVVEMSPRQLCHLQG